MPDIIDRACELEEKQRAYFLARHQQQNRHTAAALECTECGEPIPEARRLALPGCQTCIDCQERLEHYEKTR